MGCHIGNIEINDSFEVAIGMSRKWEAREAGREVARSTIGKLDGPPNFFVLFSTIHYEKYGGFEELLKGVWDVIPDGTPLIGGTVMGFMNNYGCYARGVTALAASYPHMDVALGYGKNTKRNPIKAARQSTEMIRKGLATTKYKNKFLLNFVSGPVVMKIPGQGYKKVVDSGIMSRFVMLAFGFSQYLFQKGLGREDEVFDETIKQLPDFHVILGTSVGDGKGFSNCLFFNHDILTNGVVNLGISMDLDLHVQTTHGMKPTSVTFEITKISRDRHIIHEINHQLAVPELHRILGWPKGFLNEKTILNTILYYPISLRRNNREVPLVMPFVLKNSIMTPCMIDKGNVSILTVSGNNLIKAVEENLHSFDNIDPRFCVSSACLTILQTLGYKINIIQDIMHRHFNGKPFLLFFSAGEGTYSPQKNITYANMSFNTAVFGNAIINCEKKS